MLEERNISFKFAGGIETKMDSKAVPAARLLNLENGVFTRAISIQKRNGYAARSLVVDGQADALEDAVRLAKRDNETLLFTRNRCYSRQSGADKWTDVGACIAPVARDRAVVATGSQQSSPDHATNGGVTVYAWEDSRGGVWWSAVDATSGTVYRVPVRADVDGERPRCLAVGDVLHVYYAVPTQRRIMVIVVNPAEPLVENTPSILVDDLDTTNPNYDAVPTVRVGLPGLIAWHEHATANVRVGYVTPGGTMGSPASGYPPVHQVINLIDNNSPIACAHRFVDGADSDRIYLAGVQTNIGFLAILSGGDADTPISYVDGSPVTGATDVLRVALVATTTEVWIVFEENAAEPSERYCMAVGVTSDGVVDRTFKSVGLASRAFAVDGDAFAVFVHDTTYFNTYFTFRLSDGADAGRHLAASAAGAPPRAHLPSVQFVTASSVAVVLPYKTRLKSENNDQFGEQSLSRITLDFASSTSHQYGQIGRGLYLAGACPQHYDAYHWTEQGFHVGPELITFEVDTGGSLTVDSTYRYYVWYEWTDNLGEVHRGPTSIATVVETGASDTQVTLTLPTLRITRKEGVRICVARSLPGDANRFWRVSSLDPTVSGPNGYIENSVEVDSVTFVDEMSDEDLQEQEFAYITGGILSNDPVSLGPVLAVGKNRIFFTDASNGNVVRFSQRIAPGYGLEIAPELQHDIDPIAGEVTALAVMDGVVFVFTATGINAFAGDGPLENGASGGNAFSASQQIPSDVGCVEPSSIVLTPKGLMFKSPKGIYLITRAREVQYIGAPVEAYNAQDVRRADVMPERTQVVFLTSSGRTLLYDHFFGQWSTFTNHEGLDSLVVNGTYCYLRNNSELYEETIGQYSDAGTRIPLRLETAWLHLFDHLQGWQRFWKLLLLGTWVSPHQLGISYRTDYSPHWSDPTWLDATGGTDPAGWLSGEGVMAVGADPLLGTPYGYGNFGEGVFGGIPDDVYQWRFGVHEDGQAIQLRFEDFEKDGLAGASFELTEMTFIGGAIALDTRPFSGSRSM